MPYTFTLAEGLNKLSDLGSTVRRYLLEEDTSLETLDEIMGATPGSGRWSAWCTWIWTMSTTRIRCR